MLSFRRLGEAGVGLLLGAVATRLGSTAAIEPAAPDAAPITPPASSAHEGEPMREHADDVVDYELRAVLDMPQHTVHGEGTIVWRNKSKAAVRELWVHLYMNGFKNQRTAFLRAPVGGGRG